MKMAEYHAGGIQYLIARDQFGTDGLGAFDRSFESGFHPFSLGDAAALLQQARSAANAAVRDRDYFASGRGRDQGRGRESDRQRDQGRDRESDRRRDQGRDRESDRDRDQGKDQGTSGSGRDHDADRNRDTDGRRN